MKKIITFFIGLFALVLAGSLSPKSIFAAPPQNFQTSAIISTGLDGPSGFQFAPDGRIFILQRTGEVKIYKNGQLLANNFITLPSIASGDRGLIGIAFDPDYASNKYVYFYYTALDKLNYLVRFSAVNDTASDGPVIIYHTTSPSEQLHVGGGIAFGNDGKLYFTVGDNGYPPNAQSLDNPHGKILRINKDGSIPSDNPFVNTPGALPEIWAYGLRNPWRLQFDSTTGKLYDGDVGQNTWEEVNLIEKGKNYGWPTCEGNCGTSGMTNPIYTYNHDGLSSAVTGGPVYRGTMFPSSYVGRYFFADYARGFIRTLGLDANGNSTDMSVFDANAGTPVDLRVAPDGSLYYITYYPGRLYRITYSTTNQVPTASAGSNATKGLSPFTVNFTSAGSSDPENNPLSFFWDFGDGQTSTQANPSHTYTNNGSYLAQLTVSDGVNTVDAIPIVIQVGIAPTVTIGMPANNSQYKSGDSITYSVSATDGVGNDMNDNDIGVEILFHHLTHIHPFLGPLYGRNGTFVIPTTGEPSDATWFEIKATATDTNGLSTTKSVFIYPKVVDLTFQTNPTGLQITLDGEPTTTPQTIKHVVGFQRELSANGPQYVGADVYQFSGWSDGGGATHTISVPNVNTTYTANFTKTGTVVPFSAQYFSNQNLTGSPTLTKNDNFINFDWGINAPDSAIPADNFSVRWTKTDSFSAGSYEFSVTADDGLRLYIDNNLVIDKWVDQGATTYKTTQVLTSGNHTIKMEYYENGYDAVAKLNWIQLSGNTPTPTPTSIPSDPNAFSGQYFNNKSLTGNPAFTRNDTNINFDWAAGSPDPVITADNFSVRWTKTLNITSAGDYKFSVTADDGVRLKVDGTTIIDKWQDQAASIYTSTVNLGLGNHTVIMEYYENGGEAVAKLSWSQITQVPTPTPTPNTTNSFTGQYWNIVWNGNPQIPSTNPTLTRQDSNINFDWALVSPGAGINADDFVARWTKTETFTAGTYRFSVTADDGVRLYVDNNLVIDKWQLQGATTYTTDQILSAGAHTIKMEYYEHQEDAVAKLSWTSLTTVPTPTPTPIVSSNSFTGEYFNNTTLSGTPSLTRVDTDINFDWANGNPGSPIPADNFSVRWTKTLNITSAGDYKFSVTADDGVRLKVDGTTIIDKWQDQAASTYNSTKTLASGNHTVVMEYYENSGLAVAKLSFSQVSAAPTPTPTPSLSNTFTGEYWNVTWTGIPNIPNVPANVVRTDADINFDWAQLAPASGINADDFVARWTKTETFTAGTYRFSVTADDGVRLYVDNNLVIDKWQLQGAATYTTDLVLTAGSHAIKMEYFEHLFDAVSKLSWTSLGTPTPTPTPAPTNNFVGQYFTNSNLSGAPSLERTDAQINFDWGYGSPAGSIPVDNFSARWTKTDNFVGGNYQFSVSSDDGLRIKVDGTSIYDQWIDQAANPQTITVPISSGSHTITVEYYENDLTASCQVSWAALP